MGCLPLGQPLYAADKPWAGGSTVSHAAFWPGWRGGLGTVAVAPEQPKGTGGRRGGEERGETAHGVGAGRAHSPGAPPNKPANPQTRLSLLFSLLCPWALQWLRRADESQTEGERRNSYGLRNRWIPPPGPPTLPSLEKRISMPRCQGMCPLSLEGLLLGQVPGCPSLLLMTIKPYIATADPTQSFLGRGWIEQNS